MSSYGEATIAFVDNGSEPTSGNDCVVPSNATIQITLKDEQLSNAGIVQDTYVLVKLFEKASSCPKNGAQYGAPFNEEDWEDDDIDNCSNALGIIGPLEVTTTNPLGYKQKGLATVNMYEPSSSTVACSANETGNIVHYTQKGIAAMEMKILLSFGRYSDFEGFTGDNENEVRLGPLFKWAVGCQPSFLSSVATSTSMMSASAISFVANNIRYMFLIHFNGGTPTCDARNVNGDDICSTRSFTATARYGSTTPVPSYIFPIFVCIMLNVEQYAATLKDLPLRNVFFKVYDHGNLRRLWCRVSSDQILFVMILDSDNHIGSIIHETYLDFLRNIYDPDYFQERDILAPTHELVDMIDDRVGGYYLRNTIYGH
ncbi:hypothetical protein Tco_1010712 [Tanacetum coccineum]